MNYAAASKEDKEAMFLDYSGLLNSFDSDAQTKITVAVRRLDAEAFGRSALIPRKDDGLDRYRDEINGMLVEKATGTDAVVREIYVTAASTAHPQRWGRTSPASGPAATSCGRRTSCGCSMASTGATGSSPSTCAPACGGAIRSRMPSRRKAWGSVRTASR